MSTNDADRLLTAWLESVAPAREPEHLLDAVLFRTARTRRRPAWRIPESWLPMTTITQAVPTGRWVPVPLLAAVMLLILALVAALVLVAGTRRPTLPPPYGPAANGAIVYESDPVLALYDPATGATSTFRSGDGWPRLPQYSRDGTAVAWLQVGDGFAHGEFELRVARSDGTGERTLGRFEDVETFEWAPDGAWIALGHAVDGTPSISLIDVGSGTRRTLDLGMPAVQLAVRPPDGRQLAFLGDTDIGSRGLYLVDRDGSDIVKLDLDPGFAADASYGANRDSPVGHPTWSPDGRALAFVVTLDGGASADLDGLGFRVGVAEVDESGAVSGERLLRPDPDVDAESQPAWLPDGAGLVVDRTEAGSHSLVRWDLPTATGGADVATAVPLGLEPTPPDANVDLRLVVSPDGSQVLVAVAGSGRGWIVPVRGAPPTALPFALDERPTWQRLAP